MRKAILLIVKCIIYPMERVDTLIKRLVELQESHAGNNALLLTAQMLVHELQENTKTASSKSVAVIHPAIQNIAAETVTVLQPAVEKVAIKETPAITIQQPVKEVEVVKEIEEVKPEVQIAYVPLPKIEEIPTFAYQQKEVFELNMNGNETTVSEQTLNDRLKTEKRELGNLLKEAPIKDLKKAIGINDRFVFIEELFRGDEAMYERSIKTINGFTIFPEAEYWIQRELKTKIGWDEESQTVKHFDQLVRRRFS